MDHVTGTINTIKTHALIAKATSNDPKPTPGYLFPEIARLTQSPATSSLVLTQLLKIITPSGKSNSSATHPGNTTAGTTTSSSYTSSPHVLLKALKILRQLAQTGSIEFRVNLARRGKVLLVEMVGYRGTWDEVHGDRFNQDVRAVAEDLIEYMHANPVQEEQQQHQQQDGSDASNSMTEHESAVLRGSTQDLPGFGNPEYDESSDSDDDVPRKSHPKTKKRPSEKVPPPLPGFGNPLFEKENASSEPTLMTRLVDRLQEMTAPPPPIAMRTAYRQQEQRRQKLFVGEYSMREGNSQGGGTKNGGQITIMGTNPFRRSSRAQGMVAGGWGEKKVTDTSRPGGRSPGPESATTSRTFPLVRSNSRTISFRNGTSEAVYGLAPHIQTNVVRSTFQDSAIAEEDGTSYGDLLGGTLPSLSTKESSSGTESGQLLLFWGTAKDICDVVLGALMQDKKSNPLADPFEETVTLTPSQGLSILTGLVRDMIDWIEQEDWERRLRYLFVLDALVTHPGIGSEFLGCSALPVLLETLTGPLCEQATQRSVRELSTHLSRHIKQTYGKSLLSRVAAEASDGGMHGPPGTDTANNMLLELR